MAAGAARASKPAVSVVTRALRERRSMAGTLRGGASAVVRRASGSMSSPRRMGSLTRVAQVTRRRHRILALFRPYRRPLASVLTLIVVSAGLGILSPFLLREVLDVALPERDKALLAKLV